MRNTIDITHALFAKQLVNKSLASTLTFGSKSIVEWRCNKGHIWEQSPNQRFGGGRTRGCPYCANHRVLPGYNDLATTHPELIQELVCQDDAIQIGFGSTQKVSWKCSKGHQWDASPSARFGGKRVRGCPICSGNKVVTGVNDMATTHPHYVDQLEQPNIAREITVGSGKKVVWICKHGHKWLASPNSRFSSGRERGCPICANQITLVRVNDIATLHPHLVDKWSDRNNFTLSDINSGSKKKGWFICSQGHEYCAIIRNVVSGTGCTVCPTLQKKDRDSVRAILSAKSNPLSRNPRLVSEWSSTNAYPIEQYSAKSNYKAVWECDKGHTWRTYIYSRTAGSDCPRCSKVGTSKPEKAVADYVESLGFDIIRNDRSLIAPREIDILIPGKLAIEFNGLYWHTEQRIGRTAHYDKWKACFDVGVQLVTIWEDDWRDNEPVVKALLAAKLGVHTGSIGARKTVAKRITYKQASAFLNEYHIQGSARGSDYIGLFTDKLVAVTVVRKNKGVAYLERYASSTSISGGLDKSLKALSYTDYVTFADLSVSDGNLYEKTGWIQEKILKPDYKYLYNGELVHKFNFRLARFRTDPGLLFEEGLSESQLAELNGIPRVYDCGKIRYVRRLDPAYPAVIP